MSYKDIAVTLFSLAEDKAALAAAETLAAASGADLTAVLLELQPDPVYTMDGAMAGVMWAELVSEAQKGFAKEKAALGAHCEKAERPIAIRELLVASGLAANEAAVQARHADLTVMLRPGDSAADAWRTMIFEGVLFGSGRPVLLTPPDWRGPTIGRRIVIAWNGKREAARALADAGPFLETAEQITVVTVDAKPSAAGFGPAPGADVAAHLARRGYKVELRNVDGLGRDEGDALIAKARAIDADLIVMGGYGRARLREMVFGGVTRTMVEKTPLPVLMSH